MGFREKSSTRLTSGLHGRRCGGRDSADALGAGAPAASRTARQLTDAAGSGAGLRGLPVPRAPVRGATGATGTAAPHRCRGVLGRPLARCALALGKAGAVGAWQDLRAVHDLRSPDGKRGPSRQDLCAMYSQTAVCRAFRMHSAHILPKPAHFGYMVAKCCHEPALFPSEAPSGTHEAKKLPRLTAREYATAKCCHGSPPWEHATAISCCRRKPRNA